MYIKLAGRSCLHMVDSWKSDPQLACQRLPTIHFLVHECGADINVQVTVSAFVIFLFHFCTFLVISEIVLGNLYVLRCIIFCQMRLKSCVDL